MHEWRESVARVLRDFAFPDEYAEPLYGSVTMNVVVTIVIRLGYAVGTVGPLCNELTDIMK